MFYLQYEASELYLYMYPNVSVVFTVVVKFIETLELNHDIYI